MVKRPLVNKFTPLLKEGKIFVFMNFCVGQQFGWFKPCKNPFRIYFLYSISIRELEDVHGFQFSSSDKILSRDFDDLYLVGEV